MVYAWGKTPNPITSLSKTSDSKGNGSFTSRITGLTANTNYYVRAYATNGAGNGYGNETKFTTKPYLSIILTAKYLFPMRCPNYSSSLKQTSNGRETLQ